MAPDDSAERRGEGRHVERAGQAQGQREVVDGAALLELLQEPEALLGEGERQISVTRYAVDRRRLGSAPRFNAGGQSGERGGLEEGAQRQLDSEDVADPRHHPRAEQRMTAKLEEAVFHADLLNPEE